VKVFGVILTVLVLLFVIGLVTGGHGPGRHMRSGGSAGQTPRSSAGEGHAAPEGSRR